MAKRKRVQANRNLYWICPYFKWDGITEVSCEGGRIKLPNRTETDDYLRKYCASYEYGSCSVAKQLNEFFGKEEK